MDHDATRPAHSPPDESASAMWETLLITYALGAATDEEAASARARLTGDPEVARMAADYAAIAAVLPELFAEGEPRTLAPSTASKHRVLAAVRATRQEGGQPDVTVAPASIAAASDKIRARRGRPRGDMRVFLGWAVAAVLLIACVTLMGVNVGLRQQTTNAGSVMWVASRSSHAYTMQGTANAPTANAVLLESTTDGKVVLLANGFPTCTSGQVYRVWLRRSTGAYVAATTFTGGKQETLVVPGTLQGIQEVVISAEARDQPASAPSGTTVMEGALA